MININVECPRMLTIPPGPESIKLATQLKEVEATCLSMANKGLTPIFLKRASGVVVEDVDGNSYLDCTSFFGVATVGHNHPRVISDIVEQCYSLVHTMTELFPHRSYVEALQAIVSTVGRWDHTEVLLCNTGSEAIEVALKLSLAHTGKPGVIAFQGAFHGQSLGALSVTSFNRLRQPFIPYLSHHTSWVPYPNPYRPPFGASSENVGDACLSYIEQVLRRENTGVSPIGAILLEPIQNLGGYIVPPSGFLRELRQLCNHYDVLLILDELFTGFGRTGYWLAMDYENIIADIVCIGKGMTGGIPCSACIADHSIMSALISDQIMNLHGHTFSGNPIACTAIATTIDVLRSENLIDRARNLGERLTQQVLQICEKSPHVGDVRGRGASVAIEFVKDRQSKERDPFLALQVMAQFLTRGVITLIVGLPYPNVLCLYPPFVITDRQVDYVLEALAKILETEE